jgi:hypothetical protein
MQSMNDIFEEFAAWFVGVPDGARDVVHPERLDRTRLDYSIESLKAVDEYLGDLHRSARTGRDWDRAALWAGA